MLVFFIVLASLNPLAAQEKLSDKPLAVPAWLNKAIVRANQVHGGHHVYADWTAYASELKTSRVKLGMLVTILNSDGSGTVQTYNLKTWATTTALPLQSEWEKVKNTLAEILEQNKDAGGFQIKNLQDPTDDQDAVTKIYVDSQVGEFLVTSVTETEMYAITSPAKGKLVMCSDCSVSGTLMIYYNGSWISLGDGNSSPKATAVAQAGAVLKAAFNLNGSYVYLDLDSDAESGSTYQWYRADDAGGTNEIAIAGATATTYTMQVADVGNYIRFAVKPRAATGVVEGIEVKKSTFIGPVIPNEVPTAHSLAINIASVLKEGYSLNGNYSYSDVEGDAQSGTTYMWYRADDNGGTNETAIAGATNTSYTMTALDVNKYIRFGVIPAAATGNSPGNEVFSDYEGAILANEVPLASSVNFTGILAITQTLSGTYSYSDTEGDPENGTTFKWYRANNAAGTGAVEIAGATATNYILTTADVGNYVSYAVTPRASSGNSPGNEVFSVYQGPILDNLPPVASSVTFAGDLMDTKTLTGSYVYSDNEGDAEGITTFKWYRANDAAGSGVVEISGAITDSYDIVTDDVGKYISYAVTPVSLSGSATGSEALSPYQGPVSANLVPVIASSTVTGATLQVGYQLGANYSGYSDAEGDPEGTHLYQWYIANDNSGTGSIAISGETGNTYDILSGDIGKYISVGITPIATAGNSLGIEVLADYVGAILPNQAPVITGLSLPSSLYQTASVNATYTYSDNENDAEGTHIYNWEIAVDNMGSGAGSVSTSSSYTLQAADIGKYLRLTMTPKALVGNLTGTPVQTSWVGPVKECGGTISHNGTTYNTVLLTPPGKDASCWMKESIQGNFSGIAKFSQNSVTNYYSAKDVLGNPYGTIPEQPVDYRHETNLCPSGWALPSYQDFESIRGALSEISKLHWNIGGMIEYDSSTGWSSINNSVQIILGSNYSVAGDRFISSSTYSYYFSGDNVTRQGQVYQWFSSISWERNYFYQIKCIKK